MSIPPSSPYPQSIQGILDEGRRNAEAARNAPKPHPAQPMLDYHEQVARENNAYDYDPELLAELASQNQQQATPTDAIKFGHDNGLFDHFPDDMVPAANPQQSVRVAGNVVDFHKLVSKNLPKQPKEIKMIVVKNMDHIGPSDTIPGAVAKIAQELLRLQNRDKVEFGLRIYMATDGKYYPTSIVTKNDPTEVDLADTLLPHGATTYADVHTERTRRMSDTDYQDNHGHHQLWQFMISADGTIQIYNAKNNTIKEMPLDEFISTFSEQETSE